MNVYEKARAMGLDERQIALAQAAFTPGMNEQHVMIHEAMDRVLIHARAYDNPGKSVNIEGRIGFVPASTVSASDK